MSHRWLPANESEQKALGRKVTRSAESLRKRWKYDDRFFRGEITPWVAAFTIGEDHKAARELFRQLDLNETNPFHWRALFEMLLSEVVKKRGRPPEWIGKKLVLLALDAEEICRHKLQKGKGASGITTTLQQKEPFKSRYQNEDFGVLVKQVARVIELIEPMDDGALLRLAKLYPDVFDQVFHARDGLYHPPLTEEYLARWD
jgi:hypothetical protein